MTKSVSVTIMTLRHTLNPAFDSINYPLRKTHIEIT